MQVSEQILESELAIIANKINIMYGLGALLRKYDIHNIVNPMAISGNRRVTRSYEEECDIIVQYLKGIRDEKRLRLEYISNNNKETSI